MSPPNGCAGPAALANEAGGRSGQAAPYAQAGFQPASSLRLHSVTMQLDHVVIAVIDLTAKAEEFEAPVRPRLGLRAAVTRAGHREQVRATRRDLA